MRFDEILFRVFLWTRMDKRLSMGLVKHREEVRKLVADAPDEPTYLEV